MTNYKGAALKSQRIWSKEERESKAADRLAAELYERESDDGRADEPRPDSGWCGEFNRQQRGDAP